MSNTKNLEETVKMLRAENERLRRDLVALGSKIPYKELLYKHQQLITINEIVHSIVSERDLEKILLAICEGVKKIFGYNRVGVMLINEEKKLLEGKVSIGLPQEYVKNLKLELKPTKGIRMREVIARSAFEGKPILVKDRSADPSYAQRHLTPHKTYSREFVAIPLKTKQKIYGSFVVAISEESSLTFTDEVVEELKFFGEQTAILVENHNLNTRQEEIYLETISALAEAIEAKDVTTRGHSDRLVKYVTYIGERMDLGEKKMKDLKMAAILHDIGKIGIHDKILLKPTQLEKEEYEIMKKHPEIGTKILGRIRFMEDALKIVKHHHERCSGKGYPDGLKGEAIPLGARILAVADAFDAMIFKRPYKKAMSRKKACNELKKGRGTQFDSKIIDIFLDSKFTRGDKVKL